MPVKSASGQQGFVDSPARLNRPSSPTSRKAAWLAAFLIIFPLVLVAAWPRVQDYIRAVSLLERLRDPKATGRIANYEVHPVDIRDTEFEFRGRPIPARLYFPRGVGFAPGIVVVHGMHHLGRNEPRLVAFARSLAASGFFVMTPEVPGIADYRVEAESADLIGRAVQTLAQQLETPKVGILALSFSGGLALLTASDPEYSQSIAWVATVGAHYDLAHVLRFFATDEALRPDGTKVHCAAHEYGPLIVISDEAQDFFPKRDVAAARKAIKLLLSGQGKASEAVTSTLSAAGQQTMQRIYHKQREDFRSAVLAEIDKKQEQLTAASPAGHLRFIRVPVLLLHGSDDTVIPPTELLWLQHDIPSDELLDALVSPALSHVEVGQNVSLQDRLALVHWIELLIHQARITESNRRSILAPSGVVVVPRSARVHGIQLW